MNDLARDCLAIVVLSAFLGSLSFCLMLASFAT